MKVLKSEDISAFDRMGFVLDKQGKRGIGKIPNKQRQALPSA